MIIAVDRFGDALSSMPVPEPGQTIILVWFTMIGTPGSDILACSFRDRYRDFLALDARIIGICKDSVERMNRWADEDGIQFEILSLRDHSQALNYGAISTIDQSMLHHTVNIIGEGSDVETVVVGSTNFATIAETVYSQIKDDPMPSMSIVEKRWRHGFCPEGAVVNDCFHYDDGKWVARKVGDGAQFVFYRQPVGAEDTSGVKSAEMLAGLELERDVGIAKIGELTNTLAERDREIDMLNGGMERLGEQLVEQDDTISSNEVTIEVLRSQVDTLQRGR
jgi:peroxiredoxin